MPFVEILRVAAVYYQQMALKFNYKTALKQKNVLGVTRSYWQSFLIVRLKECQ